MALVVHHPAQKVPTRAARRVCSGIRQVHLIERRLYSSATVATLCEVLECQPATCSAGKARMQWPGYAASSGRWNSTGRAIEPEGLAPNRLLKYALTADPRQ